MLTRLKLTDFMAFQSLDIHLDRPLVLFVGENESGKTTIREAVTWALTGYCRGVSKKNAMPDIVIRNQAKRASVELSIGPLDVARSITRSGSETLKVQHDGEPFPDAGIGEMQAELYTALGADADCVGAALDSWAFLALDKKGRQDLLFRAANMRVTSAAVLGCLSRRGIEGDVAGEFARKAAKEGFRAAETAAIERRRSWKRELDKLHVEEAPRFFTDATGTERDLTLVKPELLAGWQRGIERELEEAIRAEGVALGEAERALASLRSEHANLLREATELAADDDIGRVDEMAETLAKREEKLAALKASEKGVQDQVTALRAELAGEIEVKRPEVCPVIPGGFKCPATAARLEKHKAELDRARKTREERLQALQSDLTGKRLVRQNEEKAVSELFTRVTDLQAAQERLTEIESRVVALNSEEIPKAGAAVEAARARGDEAGTPAAEIRLRLDECKKAVEAKRAWDAYQNGLAQNAVERAELQTKVEDADAIAKAFQPDGVESELLREALEPLRDRLKLTRAMLGNLVICDDLELLLTREADKRLEVHLSRSQRLRLGMAFQDALSFRSGLGFIAFDELDVFDPKQRGVIMPTLLKMAGNPYGRVLGFATLQLDRPMPPPSKEVRMFWLHGGSAEVVE